MPNVRKRQGTASEHQVVGQLLDAGFDVYQTIVDDQGIDAVLRVPTRSGRIRYFDLQIKSSRTWNGIRGKIAELSKRENTVLILFNSKMHECLWFDAQGIAKHFPRISSTWGDVFLDKARVSTFVAEERNSLSRLLRRLETVK